MKINKREFNRLMNKANVSVPVNENKINDLKKYMYWANKSSELSAKMGEFFVTDREKYNNLLHECILCELEKNRYCILSKKEMVILYALLKFHNSVHKEQIFMNKKGLKRDKK